MKWGLHRGRKLCAGSSEHRHENIVFTNQSSLPTQASSWIADLPGHVREPGDEAPVVLPLGLEPAGDLVVALEEPDLGRGPDGDPVGRDGHAHRRVVRVSESVNRPRETPIATRRPAW